ncbi:MAG: hypothetical protein QX197_04635 [Methylococcaceae bacterium]
MSKSFKQQKIPRNTILFSDITQKSIDDYFLSTLKISDEKAVTKI